VASAVIGQVTLSMAFSPFKEPSIAFGLSRRWRWTAAPGVSRVASLPPLGPVPALPTIYKMLASSQTRNSATLSYHPSSCHICSGNLPIPSPIHGYRWRCAAFWDVHPSQTYQGSSALPISHNHCRCGPLSDLIIYSSPLVARVDHRICAGTLGYIRCACLMPAGVTMSGLCVRRPQ